MYNYRDIRVVHLEVTQRCQAACPMCDRNENGGADNKHITNAELSLEDCKQIFKPEFIKQLNSMYMCGNLGDPLSAADSLYIFKYFREHNPTMWLSMNTNGGARDADWWTELAKTFGKYGTVIFSVDGLSDTNHLYRQNVVWSKVEAAMKNFIAAGGRARWDYIIFEHNQHQVEEAELISKDWGVEKFIKKKTARFFSSAMNKGKDEHQAQNRRGTQTITLRKPEIKFQNPALNREHQLINTYGSMNDYYNKCEVKCKVKEEGNIFITAEGLLMPCCWTAGRMYKWWHNDYKTEQIWDYINSSGGKKGISVIDNSLQDVIDFNPILRSIEDSWKLTSIQEGKLEVCSQKCGTEFDAFADQYK